VSLTWMKKRFLALLGVAGLTAAAIMTVASSASPTPNPLSIYRYTDTPSSCSVTLGSADAPPRPVLYNTAISTSPYTNTIMSIAGDTRECFTLSSGVNVQWDYFTWDTDKTNGYSIGEAFPSQGSPSLTLDVSANQSVALATNFIFTDTTYSQTTIDGWTPNIAQIGRESNSGNNAACAGNPPPGSGTRCYGMVKITLADPHSNAYQVLPQCVAEGGTTSDISLVVKSKVSLVINDKYQASCEKFADGLSSTEVEFIVNDLTTGVKTTADGFTPTPMGPMRSTFPVTIGNHFPLTPSDYLDQFTGLIEGVKICQQDATHTPADTEECAAEMPFASNSLPIWVVVMAVAVVLGVAVMSLGRRREW
jgi:hypothetical protein